MEDHSPSKYILSAFSLRALQRDAEESGKEGDTSRIAISSYSSWVNGCEVSLLSLLDINFTNQLF